MRSSKFEHGFSLMEAIVVVVLSSIIVLLIVTLFLSQQKAYIRDEAIAYIQENGHQALEELTSKLRQTGYMLPSSFPKLECYNGVGTVLGSSAPDSVAVWGNFSNFLTRFWYQGISGANWVMLYYQPNFKFSSMMWLWIRYRDGSNEEIHRCENYVTFTYAGKRIILLWFPENDLLQRSYPAESTYVLVSTFTREMYKIQTSALAPSLFIFRNYQPNGDELVRNIEDLQLRYKLRNGTVKEQPTSTEVNNIIEINISVVARAERRDPAYKDPVYTDGYRRRTFSTSVKPYNIAGL